MSETKVISLVREWMFVRQFSTSVAWQRMIRAAGRLIEKKLDK